MPLIPSQLNFLPPFDDRESLYSSILPEREGQLSIRILTVKPNDNQLAPIEASLSIADSQSVEQDDQYNAVSYHWGDLNELENVIIRGSDQGKPGLECKVPVTKALTAALRQFRAEASENREPLRLWIDALCINQIDAAERGSQVSSMKQIFARATSVWIWLGESDEVVERGLATLFGQAEAYHLYKETGVALPLTDFASSTLSLDEEVVYIKQFTAVHALPYWGRGWTFQENAHPRKHIRYGKLKIELRSWGKTVVVYNRYLDRIGQKKNRASFWSSIYKLLSVSEQKFLHSADHLATTFFPFCLAEPSIEGRRRGCVEPPSEAEKKLTAAFESICRARSYKLLQAFSDEELKAVSLNIISKPSLQASYLQNAFYRTSDPRDSVFALREIIPVLANVEPDYSCTPEHIFSIATEALLRNSADGLRDLQQWFHPQASPHLPSWVFDFTHCNMDVDENGGKPFLSREIFADSDASIGSLFRVAHCNRTLIHVPGFIFDEILETSRCSHLAKRPDLSWTDEVQCWVQLAVSHFQARPISRQRVAIFTQALIRTFGSDHRANTLENLRVTDVVHWEDGPGPVLVAISRRHSMMDLGSCEGFKKPPSFMQAIVQNTHFARFFVTKSLRMGLAPPGTAAGDRVAILASGDIPFVLRPVPKDYAGQEAYRIIGGCTVDGIVTLQASLCDTC
jgi:hypothetical protein